MDIVSSLASSIDRRTVLLTLMRLTGWASPAVIIVSSISRGRSRAVGSSWAVVASSVVEATLVVVAGTAGFCLDRVTVNHYGILGEGLSAGLWFGEIQKDEVTVKVDGADLSKDAECGADHFLGGVFFGVADAQRSLAGLNVGFAGGGAAPLGGVRNVFDGVLLGGV